MITSGEVEAVETRLSFLRTGLGIRSDPRLLAGFMEAMRHFFPPDSTELEHQAAIINMFRFVERGDTYFMDRHFMEMVDAAYGSVPDDLIFEKQWIQSRCGWLYFDRPIKFHSESSSEVCAIGWEVFNPKEVLVANRKGERVDLPEGHLTMPVLCYRKVASVGMFPVQSCAIETGASFRENLKRILDSDLQTDPRAAEHNLCFTRWVFTAFHLMAQRLAVVRPRPLDRTTSRRLTKQGYTPDDIPLLKVVTLRRMDEERKRSIEQRDVNWHWRWEVRGHWRNQFYPSENVHRQIFVDAYIKGPENKPFKAPGIKVFAAIR